MKNNRTFLEKLLDGAEVEWKPLKDILIRTKGTKITAAEMKVLHKDNAPLKIFAGGKTFALVNFEDIPEKDINKNPSIIVKSRGIIEFEYYDKPFSHKNEMWSYYSNDKNINIKYIYYVLKNQEPYFQNLGSKMQMPQIATPDTDKYLVPIPPLSVQTEIVKILDALTALTSELTSELILRQKQYEYYREKLLSEEELGKVGFEWKPLKEIAEYIRGVTYNKTNESPNNIGYKILRANNITLSSNTLNFDDIKVIKFDTKVKSSQMLYKNDILISAASGSREHVGKVAFIYQDIDYYFGGFMGVIRCNNNVNSRYLFHIFTSSIFQDYLNEVLNSSTINNLNSKVMDSFRLPIPPLSVQTEIVKILDKFENLTNSITEGLPLAIEQSQKRYEYYRELLLSFS